MPDGSKPTDVDSTPRSNDVDTNRRVVQELYLEGLPNCSIFRYHQHSSLIRMVNFGIDKCPGYHVTSKTHKSNLASHVRTVLSLLYSAQNLAKG